MFTPSRSAPRMRDHVIEVREAQNDSSGGSSDTDARELTIRPAGSPPTVVVTNATPVANAPSASRKARASVEGGDGAERHVGEVVIGTIRPEGVHEGAGPDVAVRPRQRAAIEIAGTAGERERALDDTGGRLVDERLRRLCL